MRVLENNFSWSASRASTFAWCHRQYWWQYYGAWGGWERNAAPEPREAYILKNLSSRWAWVGTIVHQRIEEFLKRLQHKAGSGELNFDEDAIDVEAEVERTTERMRTQWRESRRREYEIRPKHRFGLMEHEYADPVADEEWKALNAKACTAVRSFLESDVFGVIQASDVSTWFPIEALDQFDLEGVGVWAFPDFARRMPDGGVEIYDWKTGEVNPANRLQLACYTLYMQANHGIDPTKVKNILVYLGEEVVIHDFVLTLDELEEARLEIVASMDEMRARLKDVEGNVAVRDDFPLTDDLERCGMCVFRRLCGR